jgi:hypothetical protein
MVLFAGMVIVALWGWVTAPSSERFAVRAGNPPGFDGTVSKGAALIMWIVLGAVVLAGSLIAQRDNEGLALVGAGLLALLLLMEVVSVRRAIR